MGSCQKMQPRFFVCVVLTTDSLVSQKKTTKPLIKAKNYSLYTIWESIDRYAEIPPLRLLVVRTLIRPKNVLDIIRIPDTVANRNNSEKRRCV